MMNMQNHKKINQHMYGYMYSCECMSACMFPPLCMCLHTTCICFSVRKKHLNRYYFFFKAAKINCRTLK